MSKKKEDTAEKKQYRALLDGSIELFAPHNKVKKFSSKNLASIAGKVLRDPYSVTHSELKALAASVLSQTPNKPEPTERDRQHIGDEDQDQD